jgi:hypothetical protein
MKKLPWLMGSLLAFSCASAQAELTWYAGAGYRTVMQRFDDGLGSSDLQGQNSSVSTRHRWEYRASIGPGFNGEKVDWGIEVRTQPAGSVNTEWVPSINDTDSRPGLGTAWVRPHGSVLGGKYAITVGRQRTVLLFDNVAQALFGNPVRFDGFGWNYSRDWFGLNLAQYVIGAANLGAAGQSAYSYTESSQSVASTQSHFAILYAFQPYVKLHFTDEVVSTFAAGYYIWNGTGANDSNGFYNNAIHGGSPGIVGNVSPVVLDNARQFHAMSDTLLPYNFRFTGEFVRNKQVVYGNRVVAASPLSTADRTAFALSLVLGRPKKAGDFSFQYSYSNKGIGAVYSTLTNVDIPADNISHMFELRFLPADAVTLAARLQYHREKARLGGDGQLVPAPYSSREQTQRRIEINAQVQI